MHMRRLKKHENRRKNIQTIQTLRKNARFSIILLFYSDGLRFLTGDDDKSVSVSVGIRCRLP
jgi:hypothetical protein